MMRSIWKVAALVGIAFLTLWALAACGEAGEVIEPTPEGTPPPAAEGVIQIRLGEFYFQPEAIRLKEGQQVTLELVNEGAVEHEFMVGRGMEMHEGTGHGFEHDFFEGMAPQFTGQMAEMMQEEEHGTEVELEAGGKAVLTFTVPLGSKGEWEIGCFYSGHYEAGMKGELIVE